MDIVVVSIAALFASALTLFSGFGLGTLLMPVVAIFFPVEIAIAINFSRQLVVTTPETEFSGVVFIFTTFNKR